MVSNLPLPLTSSAAKIIKMKKIFTHINPDTDAIAGAWLIKKFLPGWEEAEIGFVEASDSIVANEVVDANPDVLYVDVGRGKLDHHQTGTYLSATSLCWQFIKDLRRNQPVAQHEQQAVEELIEVVTQIDNGYDLSWEEVNTARYQFQLHTILSGLRGLGKSDEELLAFGFDALDAVLLNIRGKERALEDLNNGIEFTTPWGKGIAVTSGNKSVLWVGEAKGYVVVVKKDKEKGAVEIYSRFDSNVDLTKAYNKFKEMDPESDWFLHASRKLLLNQASVNPNMRPTKLTLNQIIEVLKK